MKPLYQNIKVPATKGKKVIADAKDLFVWIDSDFVNYGANKPSKPTKSRNLAVLELTKDMAFTQMFSNQKQMALSQEEILYFVKNHKDKLRDSEYATFFLFKAEDQFFVASVYVYSDGLGVGVHRFVRERVWGAEGSHRMVVPQLTVSTLVSDPLTLELPEVLEINGAQYKRIK